MNYTIRKAVKADAADILRLVQELATYEKAPEAVEVTLEEVEADGFGPNAIYSAFVAEAEPAGQSSERGEVLGIALYYIKYSTWKGKAIYLDDIIVNEQYRRYGIGSKLFEEVVKVGKEMGIRKIDWQVLDWNEPAIEFYKKYNTVFSNEWVNCTLYKEQIQNVIERG
ncbi:MAG TPA: GNAT family N-acetyltransferase [Bacteroidia bacterium]|nr:GNAT family N-acetyltransferase [Bacteroidia bacterium]